MKGKVFIGWSGDTQIARQVKQRLEEEDFEGKVGGESRADTSLYLGQAILAEIDACNQAIFIFQKKESGSISSSTLFELGYALARLETNKIHVFYIDIPDRDQSIPSDLEGIWAKHLYNIEDEQIDDQVVEMFLSNQRRVFIGNKMSIINSYYETRSAFERYTEKPFCSEYELAQHVLFFSQAAYMFNDIHEGIEHLRRLTDVLNAGPELEQSLRFAQTYLNIFEQIAAVEDRLFLDNHSFVEAKNSFSDILSAVDCWPENEFKTWIQLLSVEALNYIYILRASSPNIDDKKRNNLFKQSLGFANNCLEKCKMLSGNANNEQCITLYRAYMYRNLSTAYLKMDEPDLEAGHRYLKLSYQERKKLLEYYRIRTISSKIFETIEMEYYLAISELLECPEDPDTLDENIDSCNDYLDKIKRLHKEKTHFIDRIERNLRRAESR